MPYIGRIRTENLFHQARPVVFELIDRYVSQTETAGVVILGGLADTDVRRFVDRHSDLDLTVFLAIPEARGYICPKRFALEHPECIPAWLPPFRFDVDVGGMSMEVNCHQLILEIEKHAERKWPAAKQEAYRCTGEVVYDPVGAVRSLIDGKCGIAPPSDEVAVLASQLSWYGWINPGRQIERGYLVNARLLLNEALSILLRLIFAANDRFWPHPKWQYEMSLDLPWLPEDYAAHINTVLGAAVDPASLSAAITASRDMGQRVLQRLNERAIVPHNVFDYVSIHIDTDRQLGVRPAIPLAPVANGSMPQQRATGNDH
jgi:hypothetical protein